MTYLSSGISELPGGYAKLFMEAILEIVATVETAVNSDLGHGIIGS